VRCAARGAHYTTVSEYPERQSGREGLAQFAAAFEILRLQFAAHNDWRRDTFPAVAERDALNGADRTTAVIAGAADLLWAQGLLIGTPEHFGYMSGAVKDFMDRTFYAVEGKVEALPYALFVSAGNDGSGAVSAIERIALGYRWKCVASPIIARGELQPQDLERCRELGQTFAAGLALGVF